ncbi:hypothetical protein OUZ56_022901 [Daphnia magna]|uniref:Uncharacterized protein n=1 Tax=Daphnia magna TaxID=35525 RepID=A0ABR0AXT3_9CRUS|nr:hypothetical protein OUZ56_022901 [Daphnia magna]
MILKESLTWPTKQVDNDVLDVYRILSAQSCIDICSWVKIHLERRWVIYVRSILTIKRMERDVWTEKVAKKYSSSVNNSSLWIHVGESVRVLF